MVMGIPTVKRKVKSYLSETLRSLIDKLSPEEKLDCVIIVFVGEVRCRAQYESSHVPAHSLKICKKGPPILTCGLDSRRLTWTTFTVWLPVWRKSEYFTGRRRRHNDNQWRVCHRLIDVTHRWTTFVQVLHRAEFRLAGGDLTTSCLLPRPHQPQGDFWRLQRESQVSRSHTVLIKKCCLTSVLWHLLRTKCD